MNRKTDSKRAYVKQADKERLLEELRTLQRQVKTAPIPRRIIDGTFSEVIDYKERAGGLLALADQVGRLSIKTSGPSILRLREALAVQLSALQHPGKGMAPATRRAKKAGRNSRHA